MRWRWAIVIAIGIYCVWGALLIAQNPGLQYDEAFLVAGAARMLHAAAPFDIPGSAVWVHAFHHLFPLMGGGQSYVGAVKDYLVLPFFALFGPSAAVVRVISMLLGAVGIWGIWKLIRQETGSGPAMAAALILAMNPAYINMTVFDNNAFPGFMAALGLVCASLAGYLRRRTAAAALLLGLAMGFGVWARANFIWLLAAGGAAALIVYGRRALAPAPHWVAIACGGILGGLPFLLYEVISRGATLRALNYFSDPLPILQRLSSRFLLLQDTLLYDGEHRQMWGGGPLPPWQMWTFPIAVAAACLVCLALRGNKDTHCAEAARFSALMLIFIGAYLFFSRLQIAEHHLIILVPFAAVVTVLAFSMLQNKGRALSAVFALIYIGSAAYWNIAAVRGLKRTGGKGMWSDGIVQLARQIGTKFPGRNIKVLDWGLQANLYVLLNGRLKSEALFSLDTPEKSSRGRPWADEIRKGGVFLLNGPKDREFPAPSEAFLKALETAPPVMHRYSAMQQDGSVYAELIEVEPNTAQHRTTLK